MSDHSNPTSQSILSELKRRFPELGEDASLPGADAVDRLNDWLAELQGGADSPANDPSDGLGESARKECVAAAQELVSPNDGIEVDVDARLSVGDDVVWVSAWLSLSGEELPESVRQLVSVGDAA